VGCLTADEAAAQGRAARAARSEFLRRRLAQEAHSAATVVTAADLTAFANTFGDLTDPQVMRGAWT
jgi:hypothetical protein